MTTKVYIQQPDPQYSRLFLEFGCELVGSALDADLVCFTGGEDVSPSLYEETLHPKTFCSLHRDTKEKAIFENMKEIQTPMVGICRGGQFLNVMNGGKMYQHVTNHTMDHKLIIVETGESILVSSTHHQMMRPSNDGRVLGVAKQNGSKEYMHGGSIVTDIQSKHDVEVVFYEKTKSLCFQPHPEFNGGQYSKMKDFFFYCVFKYCLGKS